MKYLVLIVLVFLLPIIINILVWRKIFQDQEDYWNQRLPNILKKTFQESDKK